MRKLPVIKAISTYLPDNIVDNDGIIDKIISDNIGLNRLILSRLHGSNTRHFANQGIQVSDLACSAAAKILQSESNINIDLLIFAAASSDLIEPATANIIQVKLGLQCPVMDIKNACNSFVSAIHAASAFIEAGYYENVLIVNGEKLSEVINYNPRDEVHLTRCLASYSLGDAGAAILIGHGEGSKIIYQKFSSFGEYWDLCTVAGGGSMAFRNPEKYFFESDSRTLKMVFSVKVPDFVFKSFQEAGWKLEDIDCVISHQVSSTTISQLADILRIPLEKCINTFELYGNTAAATIPLAIDYALKEGKLKRGDKLFILGMAAGISLSVQLIEW
jgi:3-oxoacyl-(acyl-carrier-protein) synthase III